MKSKLFTSLLLQILCNLVFAQSNVPELTASSPITNSIAIYQGKTVVIMPLDEYKLDNLRLEQLMNALEQCVEVDSVRQLRMVNLEQMIAAKDSVITGQSKQISINHNTIWELEQDLLDEKKKKRNWRNLALIACTTITFKLIATH